MLSNLVVVHEDRKTQRALSRTLGVTRVPVHVAASVDDARARFDGDGGVIVTSASLCRDAIVRALPLAHTVIVADVPRAEALALFALGEVRHLVGGAPTTVLDEVLATVQKLVRADFFDLEKYLGWSAAVWDRTITTTSERLLALDDIRGSLDRVGLNRRVIQQATLIADELISNAIYNAPVDGAGHAYRREQPRDLESVLERRERPRLRWGLDGRRLAIEVTDQFGTLTASEVQQHVGKLLSRSGAIRRDTAGAGLGLAMSYDASSQLVINLDRGRRGQVIGLVDLGAAVDAGVVAPVSSLHIFEVNA